MKKKLMLLAMLFLGIMAMEAKNEKQPTYLYGFATSFNDSTVYFAEIQLLDDAWVDSKTKFLYGRDSYSYQLRDYLKAKGLNAPTCVTGFANTKKKAEEKFLKLRNKYLAKGKFNIKYLSVSDFKYTPVEFDEETVYVDSSKSKNLTPRQVKKAEKKSAKQEQKATKREQKVQGE